MMKEITFAQFWDAYGLKRDKIAAERAWKRLGKRDQRAAFVGIKAYREDCEKNGRMMMYAQGYITHRRWEDELPEFSSGSSNVKIENSNFPATAPAPASAPVSGASPSGPIPSTSAERERENEARNNRRAEWERQSVSHEEAKQSQEYLRALQEC